MTRHVTSLRRLAALLTLAVLEVALRALSRLTDRPKDATDDQRRGVEW